MSKGIGVASSQPPQAVLGKTVGAACALKGDLDQGIRIVDHHIRICDHAAIPDIFIHVVFPSLVFRSLVDLNFVSLAKGCHAFPFLRSGYRDSGLVLCCELFDALVAQQAASKGLCDRRGPFFSRNPDIEPARSPHRNHHNTPIFHGRERCRKGSGPAPHSCPQCDSARSGNWLHRRRREYTAPL